MQFYYLVVLFLLWHLVDQVVLNHLLNPQVQFLQVVQVAQEDQHCQMIQFLLLVQLLQVDLVNLVNLIGQVIQVILVVLGCQGYLAVQKVQENRLGLVIHLDLADQLVQIVLLAQLIQ